MFSADKLIGAGIEAVELDFSDQSYEIDGSAAAKILKLGEDLKLEEMTVIAIHEPIARLKPSSLNSIIWHNRTLRVFQALIRTGVDPARITFKSTEPTEKVSNTLLVKAKRETEVLRTAKILPTEAGDRKPEETTEFVVNFPSASAVPINLDDVRFRVFLSAVGSPGHDAVVIEGKTDATGNAVYNKALGELRALIVFERLMRAGLPPLRVDTKSLGKEGSNNVADEKVKANDRRVTVRWTENAEIAAIARQAETPQPPPVVQDPPPPPPPPPPVAERPTEDLVVQPVNSEHNIEILAYAGTMFGGGEFQHCVKPSLTYGLGLSLEHALGGHTLRSTLEVGRTTLEARPGGLTGPLNMNYGLLREDYILKFGAIHPYFGVGAGYYQWKVHVTQSSTMLQNQGSKRDGGMLVAMGADIPATPSFTPAVEATYNRVLGTFNDAVYTLWLVLRWRI